MDSSPSPLTDAALSIRDLEVVYPDGTIGLRQTRLSFLPGEFVVLLGPSGAGKSTLLRSLNGLVQATAGSIQVADIGDIHARGSLRRHRQRCAMVFQQHQLIGRLTTLQNVLTGRLSYHSTLRSLWPLPLADKRLALDCLDRVGLLDCALRRVDELSGGQQQRVGIARAIAQQPRILLADEPVASLDPATSMRVLGLIHSICKADGITAVVSLHQVDLARRFADRVVGIGSGSVVFDGPPAAMGEPVLSAIYGPSTASPQAQRGQVEAAGDDAHGEAGPVRRVSRAARRALKRGPPSNTCPPIPLPEHTA